MARNKTKASLKPHSRAGVSACGGNGRIFHPSFLFFLFLYLMAEAIKMRQREKWEEGGGREGGGGGAAD